MSTIYLLRHGQAGRRDDYDRLSELGVEQSRRLGEHFRAEQTRFDKVIVGGLRRQRETASAVLDAMGGLTPGVSEEDVRWSEFDLDAVYAGIAPRIAAEDESFRVAYEELRRRVRDGDGSVHRQWTAADSRVVDAWIEEAYEFEGESWAGFTDRVLEAASELRLLPAGAQVAVFTSAAPVGICVAWAFASRDPAHAMRLAAVALNSNITVVQWHDGEPWLASFNSVPHLTEARLRTFR